MVASAGGNVEVIKRLIDRGANASIRIPKVAIYMCLCCRPAL